MLDNPIHPSIHSFRYNTYVSMYNYNYNYKKEKKYIYTNISAWADEVWDRGSSTGPPLHLHPPATRYQDAGLIFFGFVFCYVTQKKNPPIFFFFFLLEDSCNVRKNKALIPSAPSQKCHAPSMRLVFFWGEVFFQRMERKKKPFDRG